MGPIHILRVRRLHERAAVSGAAGAIYRLRFLGARRAQDVIITHKHTDRRARAIFATLQGKYFIWQFFASMSRDQ
jgi:hypothetical protein